MNDRNGKTTVRVTLLAKVCFTKKKKKSAVGMYVDNGWQLNPKQERKKILFKGIVKIYIHRK